MKSLTSDQIEWLMVSAHLFSLQGYISRSIVLLEFLLAFDKSNQRALELITWSYLQNKNPEKALKAQNQLELQSTPQYLLIRSRILSALGDIEASQQIYQQYQQLIGENE